MTFKEKTYELIGKNEKIFQNLITYVELIEKTNKVLNLTGFIGDSLWKEGIYQSIILMNESFKNTKDKKMLDIGAGAGFPSVPFLIYKQDFSLFISEPNKKRINFLEEVNKELSLNITFIKDRIEDYKGDVKFDLITARAVTSLKNLIEISSGIGAINAEYSFLKGPKIYDELNEANWIINELSININVKEIKINQIHYLCLYKKEKVTPQKFPRTWLIITSK